MLPLLVIQTNMNFHLFHLVFILAMVKELLIPPFPLVLGMSALMEAQNYPQMTLREASLLFKRKKKKSLRKKGKKKKRKKQKKKEKSQKKVLSRKLIKKRKRNTRKIEQKMVNKRKKKGKKKNQDIRKYGLLQPPPPEI